MSWVAMRKPAPSSEMSCRILQPLTGVAADDAFARDQQIGVAALGRAADPAAQLVELGQAELVGMVHDQGVGVGDVQAGLDDGGAEQQVGLTAHETEHDPFQLVLIHLAVTDGDLGLGHDLGQQFGPFGDGLDPVVDEEDLPAPAQFAQDRLADQLLGEARHEGLDRQPVNRRGVDDREVADAHHGHVEGARDGGGGQGHDVHHGPEGLQPLLVLDPEALLLVDDQQAEILEGHILLQQAVGADDDVDVSLFEPLQDTLLLRGGAEAREHLHGDRVILKALMEGLVMLLGQDGGGDQQRRPVCRPGRP